jgi:hypothetical protein
MQRNRKNLIFRPRQGTLCALCSDRISSPPLWGQALQALGADGQSDAEPELRNCVSALSRAKYGQENGLLVKIMAEQENKT